MARTYVVAPRTLRVWLSRFHRIPRCMICGEEFREGDLVRTAPKPYRTVGHMSHRHVRCIEEGSVPRAQRDR